MAGVAPALPLLQRKNRRVMSEIRKLDITSVVLIKPDDFAKYVPPLSDYRSASTPWVESEFRCLDLTTDRVTVGYWTGEPGSVQLDPWVYTEVCSIISGRVAVDDLQGGRLEFGPGEGFIIPKGFVGEWVTLEPSAKIFLAIY
jgi:uncharacterized cupin superfamily protein